MTDYIANLKSAGTALGTNFGGQVQLLDNAKRAFIIAVTDGGADADQAADILRNAVVDAYRAAIGSKRAPLDAGTDGSLRTALWQARKLARNIGELSKAERTKLRNGTIKVSKALAIACPPPVKPTVTVGNDTPLAVPPAPEAAPEAAPETGAPKGTDGKARKARADGSVFETAMRDLAKWIETIPMMSDAEVEAYLKLCGAMEAYDGVAVPVANLKAA